MQKILRMIFFSGYKRRCRAVGAILWFLRQILDVEQEETQRNSDRLDRFDLGAKGAPRREYDAIEEACSAGECAAELLESAIEDRECAY